MLFARYRNYLTLLARMSLPRRLQPKLAASDVVQDVFVRAHERIEGFRGTTEGQLVAWLREILVNRLADANRRFFGTQRREVGREQSLQDVVDRSSDALRRVPMAPGTTPSHGAHRREVGALVADALAELKEDDREVIVLRSLQEREWSDVALRMGRSVEAVRALWGRALQRLGAVLAGGPCSRL